MNSIISLPNSSNSKNNCANIMDTSNIPKIPSLQALTQFWKVYDLNTPEMNMVSNGRFQKSSARPIVQYEITQNPNGIYRRSMSEPTQHQFEQTKTPIRTSPKLLHSRQLPPIGENISHAIPCTTGLGSFRLKPRRFLSMGNPFHRIDSSPFPKSGIPNQVVQNQTQGSHILEISNIQPIEKLERKRGKIRARDESNQCHKKKKHRIAININMHSRVAFDDLSQKPEVSSRINEILQLLLVQGFKSGSSFSSLCPHRRGKWSIAESAYANHLIKCFRLGILDDVSSDDQPLREYLVKRLHSDNVRISNKLKNDPLYYHSLSNKKLLLYLRETDKHKLSLGHYNKISTTDENPIITLIPPELVNLIRRAKKLGDYEIKQELNLLMQKENEFLKAIVSDLVILLYEEESHKPFAELSVAIFPHFQEILDRVIKKLVLKKHEKDM